MFEDWGWGSFFGAALCSVPPLLLSVLYSYQEKLIYPSYMPPGSRGNLDYKPDMPMFSLPYEDVWLLTTDGVRIHSWFLKHPNPRAPTLLYFHGNAGNISHRLPNAREIFRKLQCNVMLVSYRGYGLSEGSPTEKGLKMDGEAALEYLHTQRNDIDHSRILCFGRSLGGAVAFYLAAKYPQRLAGLVVENTFTSIPDMVSVVFPVLSRMSFLVRSRWENLSLAKEIRVPTLLLSGRRDEIVPTAHMDTLMKEMPENLATMVKFENGTHNETWLQPMYYETIAQYLSQRFPNYLMTSPTLSTSLSPSLSPSLSSEMREISGSQGALYRTAQKGQRNEGRENEAS